MWTIYVAKYIRRNVTLKPVMKISFIYEVLVSYLFHYCTNLVYHIRYKLIKPKLKITKADSISGANEFR